MQEWRYFGAAEVGPVVARLVTGPPGVDDTTAVVLRCFACDWGITVHPDEAPATAWQHAAEHGEGSGR